MKSIVAGQSNVAIDASQFVRAAWAFGENFDLFAGLEIESAIDKSAAVVQRAVVKRAKRHRRTGRLERQIRIATIGAGWDHTARVKSGGSVAHLIAGGVRAHKIPLRSVNSRAMPLYVGSSITGYAQSVEHRAVKGDPYFHVGAVNSRLAINAILNASARRLVTHLSEVLKGAR